MTGHSINPIAAVGRLITWILGLTGRLIAGIIGTIFILTGAVLCLTVIGGLIGIPLIILGVLLVIRCLF
jgi:hypothetical protein